MDEIFKISSAILASLGTGTLIIGAFSTWLGKVWAARILEKDRVKYQTEMEQIKADINKKIHEHNVAVTRIDTQRAEATQTLYATLIQCHEAALNIMAPHEEKDFAMEIPRYYDWAKKFRRETENLEKLSVLHAISLSEETYIKLSRCGLVMSRLSIDFCDSVFNMEEGLPPEKILENIESARANMDNNFKTDFEPAKKALIKEFREIMDPRLSKIIN